MASLASLIDCTSHRSEIADRVDKVEALLRASHQVGVPSDVGVTARGLSMVLLFAAYERLLTTLCRSLLEVGASMRVGVARLQPGFRLFSVFNQLSGVTAVGNPKIWSKHGQSIVEHLRDGRPDTINTDLFPADGSYMRQSQVRLFCVLFGLGEPGPLLREVWGGLETVVIARNDIAHGTLPADEVGRLYSLDDMLAIAYLWKVRWTEFIDEVEKQAASRDFYRMPK